MTTVAGNDNRPPVYREGERWVLRASSFGQCSTALARHSLGMGGEDYPATVRQAMNFGTDNEHIMVQKLRDQGVWRVLDGDELAAYGTVDEDSGQLALELTVGGRAVIRCHPDGVVENTTTGERRVLEIKIMARGNDPQKSGMYDWQFSIESAVTKLPVLLVVGWKDPDPDNGNMRVLADDFDVRSIDAPYGIGKVKGRALMLVKLFDQVADDPGLMPACDRDMYPCPFYQLHDKIEMRLVDENKITEVERIVVQIERCKERERDGKAATEARRILQGELVGVVGWKFKGVAGGWKITTNKTTVPESTRVVKAHERETVKIEQVKDS